MHYTDINTFDVVNGPGIRVSLFVSGCTNHCKGCFQPETWDFEYGEPYTKETKEFILDKLGEPGRRGLTLLGGEPFEPSNQRELIELVKATKEKYPNKDIWAFTGSVYEDLKNPLFKKHCEVTDELLDLIDVLVDGPFIEELKDVSLAFRGSSNQRILNREERSKLY